MPSSSLLPTDPSVLFTTAGMQQFKPYYTGEADPMKYFGSLNTVSIQKCLRTSDIERIGDNSHLTFLEMLGNFSFGYKPGEPGSPRGGYFKEKAIQLAHEFITKEMGLKIDYVSVFGGESGIPADTESEEFWREIDSGIEVRKFGRADNFWGPTGSEGPCGPTTEIYINGIEVWNIVFNEFFSDKDEALLPLAKKGIDTGMGLERLAMAIQKKTNVFETDLFAPLIEETRGKDLYDYEQNETSERIIADHLRASVFLIADGVAPSNVEQGYILRRLLRRAIRHAKLLNLPEDLYERVLHVLVHDIYSGIYPELKTKQKKILAVILAEKDKFSKTLGRGMKEFRKLVSEKFSEFTLMSDAHEFSVDIESLDMKQISGKDLFAISTTYGFPLEMCLEELGAVINKTLLKNRPSFDIRKTSLGKRLEKEFEEEFKKHQELSRTASVGMFKGGLADTSEQTTRLHTVAHLMLEAMRRVLGSHVQQKGSNITSERLRFDFSHGEKITSEQIEKIEKIVNEQIQKKMPVHFEEMSVDEAKKTGATGVFEHKYGDKVKVYFVGNEGDYFSKEICGGPHVKNTGEIDKFKIVKEESVSAGTRRIKATVE